MSDIPSAERLAQLADQLRDAHAIVRQIARKALLAFGRAATPTFVAALDTEEARPTRWEGAKGLSKLGDPTTAHILIKRLHDEDHAIRWLAAEGIIKMGRAGLRPLLEELERHPSSDDLQEGAHHILHDLLPVEGLGSVVQPVYDELSGDYAARLRVPAAAAVALSKLDS